MSNAKNVRFATARFEERHDPPLKGLLPAESVEVELSHQTPAIDRSWRPIGAKYSLSVPVEPLVVDVFTSPKDRIDDRRAAFFEGESMQWNVVHRVNPLVKNVPYNVTIHLQRIGLASIADEGSDLESVFPVETSLSSNWKYQFAGTLDSWYYDALPPFGGSATGTRAEIVAGIARGAFGLITLPGVWRMSALVTILSTTRRTHHLRSFAWDYEIVKGPRADR